MRNSLFKLFDLEIIKLNLLVLLFQLNRHNRVLMISRLDLLLMVMQIVFLLLLDSLILHLQQLNLLHHFFVLLFDILDGFRHCKVLNSVFIVLILLLFFGSDQSRKLLDLLFHFDGSCVVLFLLTIV